MNFPYFAKSELLSAKWKQYGDLECCQRCGKESVTTPDSFNSMPHLWGMRHHIGGGFYFCEACTKEVLKWEKPLADSANLIVCANYIERAVSCRKRLLRTGEKSEQQASLERCLSTLQREF